MSTADSSLNPVDATIRSNVVTINDQSNLINSIAYVAGSLKVTSEQPFKEPPSITPQTGGFKIELMAGRKGSGDVAQAFNSECGGEPKEYAPSGGGGTPGELNFLFGVQLTFSSGGTATVFLAQGHYLFTNNWWIGGNPIFSEDKPRLEYTYGNTVYTFELSGDQDTFNLKLTGTRPFSRIQNVFVLMMENHSFDNMLALSGIPNIIAATTSNFNTYGGVKYNVQGNAPSSMPTDPGHEFTDVVEQLAGAGANYPPHGNYPAIDNSGFAANYATTTTEGTPPPAADIGEIMMCFDTNSQLPVLYDLASSFVVCDQWFSSLPGPTWPNRFFLHGASSNGLDHSPTGSEMGEWETKIPSGFAYPHGSIFDRMNANGITYRLYHDDNGPIEGMVSQVSSIQGIDLADVYNLSSFASDVQSGSYPYQYTFIEPNYGDVINSSYENGSSQHPMDGVTGGEALILKVYETLRNSPLWESSLLIVTYDEHGGFYDHFAPGSAQPPNDGSDSSKYNEYGFTFAQYGVRVPAVIVSPLLGNYVDHTVYDHTSVLATLEWLFGLQPLTERDARANPIFGVATSAAPRTDCPTKLRPPAALPKRLALTQEVRAARELEPVPDRSSLMGFLGVLVKADAKLSGTPEGRAAAIAKLQSIKSRGEARAYLHEVMEKVRIEKARRAR